jgi:hypothetical protein
MGWSQYQSDPPLSQNGGSLWSALWWEGLLVFVPMLTFIVSAVGTAATVIFNWRSDRRATREAGLKITQLELQVAELKQKLDKQDGEGR